MNEEIYNTIKRKIIHIKSRPTKINVNDLYITLKNIDNNHVPKIKQGDYSYENIIKFCNDIENMLNNGKIKNTNMEEINQKKYISIKLEESLYLPSNIYFTEKTDDEIIDDDNTNNEDIDITDSEQEMIDDDNDIEEYYDSGGDDCFSQ